MKSHLDISYKEKSVPKMFSDWVKINHNKVWVGMHIWVLLSDNELEKALWIFNDRIWDMIEYETMKNIIPRIH